MNIRFTAALIFCFASASALAQPSTIKVKPHPLEDSIAHEICTCIIV